MRVTNICLILLTMLACVACAATPSVGDRIDRLRAAIDNPASDYVVVIAHRGCWEDSPENSIAAIEACIAAGVDMVELDVRATRDGELVLMHDETLDRTTNRKGSLTDYSLDELSGTLLRRGAGGIDAGVDPRRETIPTLRDALIAARGNVLVNIDAKADLHDTIFKIVDETGANDQVLMKMRAAPDDPALTDAAFVERALFMPIIVQCHEQRSGDNRFCADDLLQVYDDYLPLEPVAYEIVYSEDAFLWPAMPAIGGVARVWVNTLKPEFSAGKSDAAALLDPEGVWGRLVDGGVTMIQTDHPMVLVEFLERSGRRGQLAN